MIFPEDIKDMKIKALFVSYLTLALALFFYSFTQVDLSLTLSKVSVFQTLEKQFQYIGFFQRPLSTEIFAVIFLGLFICYFSFLFFTRKGFMNLRHTKFMIFLTFIILVFSYNAFSYDLFNYIFDAKIVTFYHLNPYFHKATDFPADPMLHFMRWTHRYYPYGPSWLILTVPLSFIGLNFFLPTFFLFKLLMGASYLGSAYLIYKISEKIFPTEKIFNTVFWAFNPLVIIESLVSAHNDIPMMFFMLLSIYLYLVKGKKISSFLSFIFAAAIKYSSAVLFPLYFWVLYVKRKNKRLNWDRIFLSGLLLSLVTVVAASVRTTFQPWYLIFPLTMASFIAKRNYIFLSSVIATIFCVSIYGVLVYMTDYAKGYPQIISNLELAGLVLSLLIPFVYSFWTNRSLKL